MKRIALVLAVLTTVSGAALAQGVEPTDFEQYMIEIVNRTRLDPTGEAASFGIDLNEGLDPGTLGDEPREPVAVDLLLTNVARDHTADLLANFSQLPPNHVGSDGRTHLQRVQDGGVQFVSGPSENNSWNSASKLNAATVDKLHALLFKDFTARFEVVGRGHRKVMLNGVRDMVGIGVLFGDFGGRRAGICTQNYITTNKLHVTGVAYFDDVKDDDFYTPGEGLPGITVRAVRSPDGQTFTSTTWGSGGYNVQVQPGTYTVFASGPGIVGTIRRTGVEVTDRNVKVDFGLVPPRPRFELAKAIAKLVTRTQAWKLMLKKVYFNHGAHSFTRAQIDGLHVVVDGVTYFHPDDRAELTVAEKIDKKTGEVFKVVIKDASKNKLLLDLKKSKLKVVLKNAPEFDPTDGKVTIRLDLGSHYGTIDADVTIVGKKLNKGIFEPTEGVVEAD